MDDDVIALSRLIGGSTARRQMIADKLGCNEQTLYQITAGLKLRSGNSRGIGPKLRKALNEHYPGWNRLAPPGVSEPETPYGVATHAGNDDASSTVRQFVELIVRAGPIRWASVRAQLDMAVSQPASRSDNATEIERTLSQPRYAQPPKDPQA